MKAGPVLVLSSTDTHTVFHPESEILPADWHTQCVESTLNRLKVEGRHKSLSKDGFPLLRHSAKNLSNKNIWKLLTIMLLSGKIANRKLAQKHFHNIFFSIKSKTN